MARVDNLENFLTDVAGAIREKKGTQDQIPAENFDTEIKSIETGIDTSDATAVSDDVISPKTFYSNGQKLTGSIMPTYVSLGGTPKTYSMPNNGTTICVSPDKKYTIQWGSSFYIYDVKTSQLVKTIAVSNFSGTRRYISIANVPYEESKYFMYISNTTGGLYVYSYDSEALTITYLHYTNFGHNYHDTIFAMSKEQSNIMAVASRTYIRTYRITTTGVVQISNSDISNERTGSLEFQKHDTILVHNNNYVHDANHRTYVIKLNANFAIVFNNNIADDGSTISFFNNSNYCIRVVGNNTTPKLYSYVDDGSSFSYTLVATWSLQTYASKNYYVDESDTFLISQAYNNSRIAIFKMDMTTFGDPELVTSFPGPNTAYDLDTIVPIWFGKNYSYFTWIGSGVNYYTEFLYDSLYLDTLTRNDIRYNSEYDGNADATKILDKVIAYSKGEKIKGTMPNNGELNYTPTEKSQIIPAGYTSGGKVNPMDVTTSTIYKQAIAIVKDIKPTVNAIYKQIDYIGGTGSQRLYTDIQTDSATDTYEITLRDTDVANWEYYFQLGAMRLARYQTRSTEFCFWAGTNRAGESFTLGNINDGNWHTIKITPNALSFDGSQKISYSVGGTSTGVINIFYPADTTSSFLVKEFKMYRARELISHLIPYKNIQTNVVGMYDLIGNKFYNNTGSGTFTSGNTIGDIDVEDYTLTQRLLDLQDYINQNIVPVNIRADKTIFDVTGTAPVIFSTIEEMNEHTNLVEDTFAIVYGTSYIGTYRLNNGAWTQIGNSTET